MKLEQHDTFLNAKPEDFLVQEQLRLNKSGAPLPPGVRPPMQESVIEDMPDIERKKEIQQGIDSSFSKEKILEERVIKELEDLKRISKSSPKDPKEVLKSLILKGELKKTYEVFGHQWTLRALDQGDMLTAMDDIKDSLESAMGRLSAVVFSKVVYAIEAIDGIPLYEFFPEIERIKYKNETEYMIALKRLLRAHLLGMPPAIIDRLFNKYSELEDERDKGLDDLKN